MGHPVPLYTWDFLEAFPNAKVVLTVREVDAWVSTVRRLGSWSAYMPYGAGAVLTPAVLGRPWGSDVTTRQLVRKYLEHNAKYGQACGQACQHAAMSRYEPP